MSLTIAELLESKIYVKPNGGMTYKTPEEYLRPFLDAIAPFTNDFDVRVAAESRNKNEDQTDNVAYGRVVVEAKLPEEYTMLDHYTTVGLTYALDTQKPFLKVYTGQTAWACTNLSIFNADQIFAAELTGNTTLVYEKLKKYIGSLNEGLEEWSRMCEKLMGTTYDQPMLNEKVGYMLREGMKNNFTQGITAAVKELDNQKSVYAIKNGETSAWNVLAACTQYITDKTDLTTRPDMTLFAHSLFADELMRN